MIRSTAKMPAVSALAKIVKTTASPARRSARAEPEQEGGSKRDRRERVPTVVNEVRQQGDAACGKVDRGLNGSGGAEDGKRDRDGPEPSP
jgi:hypothetical protein